MPARILLVEDEADLARSLAWSLQRDGFQVVHAETGRQGLALARDADPPFDLILLDLMLPDVSGTEVCRQLRADARTRHVLILMLTARGEEIDRVVGFEVGADDYVVKPASAREIALRLRALLRRVDTVQEGGLLAIGPLRVDLEAHRAWLDGQALALTPVEIRLLAFLMGRRGLVQSRGAVLDAVWGGNPDVSERTVDANVKRLREKLGTAGGYIETLRGVGYRFVDHPEPGPAP